MSQSLPRVLTRRHFASLSLGACVAGLAACGGGGLNPSGDATLLTKDASVDASPGFLAQAPQVPAGPAFNVLQLKCVNELADGGFAVAWTRRDTFEQDSLRHLQVQRFDRAGQPTSPVVTLPVDIPDDETAATVLRDGTIVLVWRRVVFLPIPAAEDGYQFSILHQRFDATGQPLADADVVASLIYYQISHAARALVNPKIDRWPDGSHVVAWANLSFPRSFPGLSVNLEARRYHANGLPAGDPVNVGTSNGTWNFTLMTLDVQGGYVVSNVRGVSPPYQQTIRLVDFWNPIDPSYFEGLAEFSFLVPLGVCGSLLFAGRYDAGTQATTWERQLFSWEGNAAAPPVPLPGRPAGIVPLRQLGQFLELSDSTNAIVQVAQRKDKFDKLYGDAFDVPRSTAVATLGGDVAMAWVLVSKTGNYSVVSQLFTDPYGGRDLPE